MSSPVAVSQTEVNLLTSSDTLYRATAPLLNAIISHCSVAQQQLAPSIHFQMSASSFTLLTRRDILAFSSLSAPV